VRPVLEEGEKNVTEVKAKGGIFVCEVSWKMFGPWGREGVVQKEKTPEG